MFTHRYLKYFLGFIILNILFSLNPLASIYLWSRWTLYLLFVLSIYSVDLECIITPLKYAVSATVILETLQLILQHSLGGLLYFFGERPFDAATPMVAKLTLFGRLFVRPYATFSHPNSLAGFLLLSYILFATRKKTLTVRLLSVLGIFLSLSKTVIITFLLYLTGMFRRNIIPFIIIIPLIILYFFPDLPSLSARSLQLYPAAKAITTYPLFGVGLGGFYTYLVSSLPTNQITPDALQPVHNLILLSVSEIGLVGLAFISLFVYRFRLLSSSFILEAVSLVLLTGGFDHYWWTLPQNKLILLISLVLFYKIKSDGKKIRPYRNTH